MAANQPTNPETTTSAAAAAVVVDVGGHTPRGKVRRAGPALSHQHHRRPRARPHRAVVLLLLIPLLLEECEHQRREHATTTTTTTTSVDHCYPTQCYNNTGRQWHVGWAAHTPHIAQNAQHRHPRRQTGAHLVRQIRNSPRQTYK